MPREPNIRVIDVVTERFAYISDLRRRQIIDFAPALDFRFWIFELMTNYA